jgi:hypothetical protein
MVPFTAAAHEHTELAFDETLSPEAATHNIRPIDVPAFGYMRHILIEVTTDTEGEQEAEAVTNPDFPWNLFQSISISDVNGAPIFGPLDGYAALWASICGGYAGRPDPRVMPYFSSEYKKPKFLLRIPVEISHFDGFGSLANQNAAASYRVNLTLNEIGKLTTKNKKAPKVRIRVFLEAWSLPDEYDLNGRPQAEAPPMLDSAQYHSYFQKNTQKGANTVLLVRVGSLIRNLIVIARNEAGERKDGVFANPATLEWDSRKIREDTQTMLQELLSASVPELKTRDTGVFAYLLDRSTKNTVGDDTPTLWLPTAQSTRMEIRGSAEEAGSWQIITNDVAPVAVQPAERYQEGSRTGDLARPASVEPAPRG